MTDHDADDDVPVSALIKRKIDSTADGPDSTKKTAVATSSSASKPSAAPGLNLKDEDLPEWWDDNTSVVVLMERRKKFISQQAQQKMDSLNVKREAASEKEASKPPKKEKKDSSASSSSSTSEKQRPGGVNRAADYYETKKGQLVQMFIVRWWYAYDWPLPEEIGTPPPGYEMLDGFPGVFVSMNLDSLGKILDLRDKKNCPSLKNLSQRSAKELQQLCLTALENQLEQLQKAEGEDAPLCNVLRKKMKEVKAVDCEDAEREIRKGGAKYIFKG